MNDQNENTHATDIALAILFAVTSDKPPLDANNPPSEMFKRRPSPIAISQMAAERAAPLASSFDKTVWPLVHGGWMSWLSARYANTAYGRQQAFVQAVEILQQLTDGDLRKQLISALWSDSTPEFRSEFRVIVAEHPDAGNLQSLIEQCEKDLQPPPSSSSTVSLEAVSGNVATEKQPAKDSAPWDSVVDPLPVSQGRSLFVFWAAGSLVAVVLFLAVGGREIQTILFGPDRKEIAETPKQNTAGRRSGAIIATLLAPVGIKGSRQTTIVHSRSKYPFEASGPTKSRFAWMIQIDDKSAQLVKQAESDQQHVTLTDEIEFSKGRCYEIIVVITTDNDMKSLRGKKWLSSSKLLELQEIGHTDGDISRVKEIILNALVDAGINDVTDCAVVLCWHTYSQDSEEPEE